MTQGLGQYAREPMARLLMTLMTFQMMPVSSRNCASMNGLTLGRTCYILVGLERDWASSLQTCIKHGMQPVMISDVIQLEQVVDFLKNKSNSGVWTGGKSLPDMTFVWDVNNIPVNLELVHDVTNTTREANYCLALTLNSTLVKRPCEQQLDVLCMKDDPVWLGENVVCRCKRGQCNSSGECVATTCQAGWFGPACQIKDHVHEGTFVPRELVDDNVTTCIQTDYLKVQFGDVKFIAWVSLVHNNKDSLYDLTMTLSNDLKTSYNCTELRLLNVEETVVDVRCGRGIHYVQRVELRWSTNKTLCSLHVAGGVNSALRQKTEMSRTGGVELSHYSVDGETGLGAECARTQEEPTAYWKLTFDKPRLVYEIIIHRASRRHDWSFMDGFLLESYDVSGRTVHTARGVGHTTHLQAHIHTCSTAPVLTIVMNVMGLHNSLEICEFETYGDCAPPYYGYGCASECNQLCLDRKCHYNGFCYDCELGKSGDYCETDPRSNPTQHLSSYFWDIVTLLGYLVTFGLVMWLLFYLSQRYSKKRARRRLSRRMSTGRKPQTPPKPPIEPHPDESGLSLGKTESRVTEMTSATTSTQSSEGTGTSA